MAFNPKPILGTTTGLAATALMGHSAGYAQESLKWGMKGKPQKAAKPLIKGFVTTMVGTALLGGIAGNINKIPAPPAAAAPPAFPKIFKILQEVITMAKRRRKSSSSSKGKGKFKQTLYKDKKLKSTKLYEKQNW